MNQQPKSENANPAETTVSSPAAAVRDGFGETPASNEPSIASQRLRALDVLAQCMLDAGLGA